MFQPALRAHKGNHSRQRKPVRSAGNSCCWKIPAQKFLVKTRIPASGAIWRFIQQHVVQAVVAREFHLLKVVISSAVHFDFHPRRVSWVFHACSGRAAKSNGNL
jgi:hypothetical protein